MNSAEISLMPPERLTIHPALDGFPGLGDDPRATLEMSIKEHGIQEPLAVDPEFRLYDGRARLAAALALVLSVVPVVVRPVKDALGYAIESAVNRRQMTRSAIAFLLFEQHPELATARGGKAGRPKKSVQVVPISEPASFTSLATRYRIDKRDFFRLSEMWSGMSEEQWKNLRHDVLFEEALIGRAYTGWLGSGEACTGGKAATQVFQFTQQGELWEDRGLFPRSVKSLRTCWEFWSKEPRFHSPMAKQWEELLRDMPDDLVRVTQKVISQRIKK